MDGYRSQPDPHQAYPAHYPSSHDHGYDPRAYQASAYHSESQCYDSQRPPSRTSSIARSDGLPQTAQLPLKEALSNAFDKSDSARTVDPDLIAQITAEVKRSVLDEIKLGMSGTGPQHAPPPPSYAPQSPMSTASLPPRNVYTPPSPEKADLYSQRSASPDPLTRDPTFDGAGDMPTPRYNERSAPVEIPQQRTVPRPAPAARMPTEETYTPIEKMWQRLFSLDGQPTPRLGQFLRGLAIHLIEDYEPKHSLVIAPSKMLKFYNDVKLNDEIYPWATVFGELPYSTLGKIYRDMRCQHHLIQEHNAEQPSIPALTPDGFQEWMTAMIQAYPSTEYQRLSRAVLDMPISNGDDCKERFPKELPRRLFPKHENLQAQQRCAAALSAEGVPPRRAPTFPPPPPPPLSQSTGIPPPTLERERSPYATRPDARLLEEEEHDEPLSIPIERERKPYAAAPGGGKLYEEEPSRSMPQEPSLHEQRRRAKSTAGQSQWAPPPSAPLQQQQHPRTMSQANGRRPKSPGFSNYGRASDPSFRDSSSSVYASNVYDSDEENRRFAKDAEMRRNEWSGRHDSDAAHHRRSTAGTDSSFDSQPRSVYDDDSYRTRAATNGYDTRGYEPRRY